MAEQQIIKRRIKSVSNTKQITKAMQLVAASKLRRAQEASLQSRAYSDAARNLLASLTKTPETSYNPLFISRPVKRDLTILITSDRGLAGGYNSNILRAFTAHSKDSQNEHIAICVGKYAAQHISKLSDVDEVAAYSMEISDADVELAQPILKEAIDLFTTAQVDSAHIIFTKFVSTVRQEVQVQQLLPIVNIEKVSATVRTLEPNAEELLDFAANRLLEAQLVQALLDSRASEQASRMLAMKNATDNASDLIEDLTLEFNNARQAEITQELAEISAGAEAITE